MNLGTGGEVHATSPKGLTLRYYQFSNCLQAKPWRDSVFSVDQKPLVMRSPKTVASSATYFFQILTRKLGARSIYCKPPQPADEIAR